MMDFHKSRMIFIFYLIELDNSSGRNYGSHESAFSFRLLPLHITSNVGIDLLSAICSKNSLRPFPIT